jgi:protease-4
MRRLFRALWLAALVPLLAAPTARAAAGADDPKTVPAKSVIAVFRLNREVTEAPADDPFAFGESRPVMFKDLVARLRQAKDDAAVKAVVLLPEGGALGFGQVEELRQVLAQVRAAGKEVYAHADSLMLGEYTLAAGASRLSVVPTGMLIIPGLYGETLHLRGLLDKIGVTPDFLTCGEYKSAVEMFMRDAPSPQADRMMNWLFDGLADGNVNLIAKGRQVEPAKVRALLDAGLYTAAQAQAAGLIDAVEHRQAFEALLKAKFGADVVFDKKYGQKKPPQLDLSSPLAVLKVWADLLGGPAKKKTGKDAVALVYVEGLIYQGSSQPSPLGGSSGAYSSDIRKALDEAARDDSIKAVVLRVNSQGGSAVASEIILDATKRVKAKKPFVVSMGDIAGSGGYYVACGADVLFADEATITGSIGVASGKLATKAMWQKLGITFKGYKRAENAGMFGSGEVFTPTERAQVQALMDDIYATFKGHVVAVRGKRLKKPIDELAGGRVYTGRQAFDLGLVDKLGSLQDAIEHVAGQAKLADYEIRVVPEPKNVVERLLEEITGTKDEGPGVGLTAPPTASLVELALPFLRHLDPPRLRLAKTAFQRLELLQQESVLVAMPEILILGR